MSEYLALGVCGYLKNHQWKGKTWWLDMKVEEAVKACKAGRG